MGDTLRLSEIFNEYSIDIRISEIWLYYPEIELLLTNSLVRMEKVEFHMNRKINSS